VKSRLSPEGRWLALVTEDGPPPQPRLLVIDTSTGQVANQVRADQDGFTGIRPGAQIWQDCLWFGPDGQAFGAVVENQADGARALVIWDRASGQRRIHYRLPETASAIALAADGPTLAVAEGDPPQLRIRVVNLASGQETVCQRQDDGQGRLTLLLAPGGAALTAVLEGGPPPAGVCTSPTFARVTTWALPTGAMVVDAPGHQPNAPGDFVAEGVNPDRPRPYLLRDTGGDRWELVELATGRVRAVLTGRGDPPTYTWSPDGRWLVVRQIRTPPPLLATVQTWLAARGLCSAPGTGEWYHAIDLDTGRDVPGLAGPCGDWRFSPNSRYLATRDAEGAILVWELPPPRPWGWIVLGSLAAVVGLQLAGAGFRAWRRVPRRVGG
jgi:hypothetical protein